MVSVKKALLTTLKVIGGLVALFIILVLGTVGMINNSSIQNKILHYATDMLAEKLETKIEIDSIHIGFFDDDIRLFGLRVDDRQQRKMLELKLLSAEIQMLPLLLQQELNIQEVKVDGLQAHLFKPSPEEPANYQFVIDAFKKKEESGEKKEVSKKKKSKLKVDLNKAVIEHVNVTFNDRQFSLGLLKYQKGWMGKQSGEIRQLETSWVHIKKDSTHVDSRLTVYAINYEGTENHHTINIDSVRWFTDNHKPHKRTGKPKRGWYDNGHMNTVANLKIKLHHADKDSICGTLVSCEANDTSGLHVTDLHGQFKHIKGQIFLRDMTVCMKNTTLNFDKGVIQLPNKKKGIRFTFSTSDITGTTLLTDISKPFAPVLKDFKAPLWLSTKFSGTDSNLVFKDVIVKTPDKKLTIKANGGIEGLKSKYDLNVHFNVHEMVTTPATVERIINQFPVKKFMMKQMNRLGTIRYTGSFNVLWKKEQFRGIISTKQGRLNFFFALDEKNKYLSGNVQTTNFELGDAMDYHDIGAISCRAGFRFDISKPRTAQMRRIKGGKLPIGQIDALIIKAKTKLLTVSDVSAHIVSDGAVAEGKLSMKGKLANLLCSFSFTNTDEMHKTKIKPGIHFNIFGKKSDDEKAARKAQKDDEKAARKAQKDAEKEKRKAEKEARKAEKEARKAEKAAQKAAKKAAKEAAKEAAKNN